MTLSPPTPAAAAAAAAAAAGIEDTIVVSSTTTTNTPPSAAAAPPPNSEALKKRAISEVMHEAPAPVSTPTTATTTTTVAIATTTEEEKAGPAKKKTKMTEAEKEEKRKGKEAKEEERKAKEEEKRKEKDARDKERELKKAEREEKKRAKDEEKRKKDEEKAKKERAQVRLDSFFRVPPSTPKKGAAPPPKSSPGSVLVDIKVSTGQQSHERSDYEKYVYPFFVKKYMTVAPAHAFERDEEARLAVSQALDKVLSLPQGNLEDSMDIDEVTMVETRGVTKEEIVELLHIPQHKIRLRRGNILAYSTKDILARIEKPGDSGLPLHMVNVKMETYSSAYYLELLNKLPNKFLKFAEDVRPPYNGTYSKNPTSSGLRKGRNPFERALPGINYDYDSEAEWVADEEGEDLLSEDEEDKDSEAGDSLDGFLDDEEDIGLKRGGMAVLIPTNSGMCWEDNLGKAIRPDLEEMRIGVLLDNISSPIDPFSSKYWESHPSMETKTHSNPTFKAMEPPRKPLASTNRILSSIPVSSKAGVAVKKLVPPEYMEDFKRAINGSDMTKAGLIEVLKKTFPKVGKDHIKNTLDLVAERVGDKRDDKRWVLK